MASPDRADKFVPGAPLEQKPRQAHVAQAVVLASVAVLAQVILYFWAGAAALAFMLVTGVCHR